MGIDTDRVDEGMFARPGLRLLSCGRGESGGEDGRRRSPGAAPTGSSTARPTKAGPRRRTPPSTSAASGATGSTSPPPRATIGRPATRPSGSSARTRTPPPARCAPSRLAATRSSRPTRTTQRPARRCGACSTRRRLGDGRGDAQQPQIGVRDPPHAHFLRREPSVRLTSGIAELWCSGLLFFSDRRPCIKTARQPPRR
jgi:hypothetical protein